MFEYSIGQLLGCSSYLTTLLLARLLEGVLGSSPDHHQNSGLNSFQAQIAYGWANSINRTFLGDLR